MKTKRNKEAGRTREAGRVEGRKRERTGGAGTAGRRQNTSQSRPPSASPSVLPLIHQTSS